MRNSNVSCFICNVKHIYVFIVIVSMQFCDVSLYGQVSAQNEHSSYKTVKIGEQTWMTQNLDVTIYRNGDRIPHVQDSVAWGKLKSGAWCYYKNDSIHGAKYGRLYNWYAVTDPRGLAPAGWHVPSYQEAKQLYQFLGTDAINKLKTSTGWNNDQGVDGNGTNTSGFSAVPGGIRSVVAGFYGEGSLAFMWTTTPYGGMAWPFSVYSTGRIGGITSNIAFMTMTGMSVRCIKGDESVRLVSADEYILRGNTKYTARDYPGAIQEYSSAIAINPRYSLAYSNRGLAKYYLNDFQNAITDFTKSIETDTKNGLAYHHRGLSQIEMKNYVNAIKDFTNSIELYNKPAESYFYRAFAKGELQDDMGAVQDYTNAINLNYPGTLAYANRGKVKSNLRDYRGAILDFDAAIAIDTNDADLYISRGKAKIAMGNKNGGCIDIRMGMRLGYSGPNKAEMIDYCR